MAENGPKLNRKETKKGLYGPKRDYKRTEKRPKKDQKKTKKGLKNWMK